MTDAFTDYYFTSDISGHTCPGFGTFECKPPNACAKDPNNGRRYCCMYKDVCWTTPYACASDGSTTDCGTGETYWCCINDSEVCTKTPNQINICWASAHDILKNVTGPALNRTYSSLSSAHPSATTWAFEPLELIALTQTVPTASVSSAADIPSSNAVVSTVPTVTWPSDNSNSDSSSGGLRGGGIAGVVIGVLAGLALLGVGIFLLWRRQQGKKNGVAAVAAANGGATGSQGLDEKPRWTAAGFQSTPGYQGPPVEADGTTFASSTSPPSVAQNLATPSELQGITTPQELPADYPQAETPLRR